MNEPVPKPVNRSALRLALGSRYFTARQHLRWALSQTPYAKVQPGELPFLCFAHKTPLMRKLRDVDMQLQINKVTNLKIAVQKINGALLLPGETFSYWKLIGKPTKRKGHLPGMVLKNGHFYAGTGGGLCQLSNLIYWMTLHTPLTVTQRHRHGFDVFPDSSRTQPFGSGATCFYNYGDLAIRNDTPHRYQLMVRVGEKYLWGRWLCSDASDLSYHVYEKQHAIRLEPWGGYTRHNVLFRTCCTANGDVQSDDYVVENHAIMMYAPLLSESGTCE